MQRPRLPKSRNGEQSSSLRVVPAAATRQPSTSWCGAFTGPCIASAGDCSDPATPKIWAQDTFVRAFVHFERFDPERPVLPWLIAIARRLCLDLLRRRKVMVSAETILVTGSPAPGPESEASIREQLSRLDRALAELAEGPRQAIILFHIEDMSYRDIAAALEVPMGTVMTWLHRGRAQLKRALEGAPIA